MCWVFVSVRGLSLVAASGGHSSSRCAGLSLSRPLVAEHRLQTRRLSSCGSQAQLLRGMWDLPRPELEPVSPALAGGFSTTAPPGKPPKSSLFEWTYVFQCFCDRSNNRLVCSSEANYSKLQKIIVVASQPWLIFCPNNARFDSPLNSQPWF